MNYTVVYAMVRNIKYSVINQNGATNDFRNNFLKNLTKRILMQDSELVYNITKTNKYLNSKHRILCHAYII